MFWRMIGRALLRQRGKRSLVALTVALGVSLSTAILSVMLDAGDKMNAELKTFGANIVVRPTRTAVLGDLYGEITPGARQVALAEDQLVRIKTIFWAFNIVDFAPFLETEVSLTTAADSEARVTAVGVWFAKQLALPTGEAATTGMRSMRAWWDVEGAWVADDETGSAMVGTDVATDLGIAVGDTIGLGSGDDSVRLRVAGIFDSGSEEDATVVAPLAVIQRLSDQPNAVSRVEVSALTTPENELSRRAARNPDSLSARDWETWYCTAYVSSIAYQIEEVLPDAVAKPVRQVAESEGVILEKIQFLMLLIAALSLVGAALGIANLVTASVMERAGEIGLLKAVGATDLAVVALILTEITFVGLLGGVVGYAAGLGLAQVIGASVFGSAITFKPIVIPIMAILVLAVVAFGSTPSIRMLLSLRPAEVLHGR